MPAWPTSSWPSGLTTSICRGSAPRPGRSRRSRARDPARAASARHAGDLERQAARARAAAARHWAAPAPPAPRDRCGRSGRAARLRRRPRPASASPRPRGRRSAPAARRHCRRPAPPPVPQRLVALRQPRLGGAQACARRPPRHGARLRRAAPAPPLGREQSLGSRQLGAARPRRRPALRPRRPPAWRGRRRRRRAAARDGQDLSCRHTVANRRQRRRATKRPAAGAGTIASPPVTGGCTVAGTRTDARTSASSPAPSRTGLVHCCSFR